MKRSKVGFGAALRKNYNYYKSDSGYEQDITLSVKTNSGVPIS